MAITQEPVVTYNGKTLAKSEDHELSHENNTDPGPTANAFLQRRPP